MKVKLPSIPKLPKAPNLNIPKMRSKVYAPSWKQMGKGKFPAIKVKSDPIKIK